MALKDQQRPVQRQAVANADNLNEQNQEGQSSLLPPEIGFNQEAELFSQQSGESAADEKVQGYATMDTWDSHSNRRLAGMHPAVLPKAREFINRADHELGIKLRVPPSGGFRSFAEQDRLKERGASMVGGGYSYHNYGMAVDVVEIKDGQALWNNPNWNRIANLGKSLGFEWGGDWRSFVDKPHFQMTFGLKTSELLRMKKGDDGFVILDGLDDEGVQQDIADKQGNSSPSSGASSSGMQLQASVGKGGKNNYEDVIAVQKLLNANGARLVEDGDVGPLTIAAISSFQQRVIGFSDGLVEVNRNTWNALVKGSAAVSQAYKVKAGDTMNGIANANGISLQDLLAENPSISNPNLISIGQTITIPSQGQNAQSSESDSTDKTQNTEQETPQTESESSLIYSDKVSPEFALKVQRIAATLGVNPNYLMAAMHFESGGTFSPSIKNAAGSGATGLIQFMPSTARSLGTSTSDLAKMTAEKQLDYVLAYFQQFGQLNSLEDVYMAILWPRAIGKPNSYVLWSRGSRAYAMNSGLDSNKDGTVTKAEAAGKVRERYDLGMENQPSAEAPQTSEQSKEEESSQQESGNLSKTEPGTANFSLSEFHSKDGTPVPEEYYGNLQSLMDNLEILRSELGGSPIRINSGYRSPAHNASVKGKPGSKHLLAQAADFVVSGHSNKTVQATVAKLIEQGKMKQGGLGHYNTFTHYDVRGSRARW